MKELGGYKAYVITGNCKIWQAEIAVYANILTASCLQNISNQTTHS